MNNFDPHEKETLRPLIERFKFPRIKHIFDESGRTRDDLLVTEEERVNFFKKFNSGLGVLTEKLDGFNIGIGFTQKGELRLRHRNDLGGGRENKLYRGIYEWAERRQEFLRNLLGVDAVLFIEWMEWQHTVPYDNLTDFAQVISLFDAREGKNGKYMSHRHIKNLFRNSGVAIVPEIVITGPINTANDCLSVIRQSNFSNTSQMEGLILRVDDGDFNEEMAKFVHPNFRAIVDQSQHWSTQQLHRNSINYQLQAKLLDV